MWDNATIMMLVEGTFVTLYMTLVSTFMGYVLGLPMGIALVITAPKGLRPNKIIYKILDVIVNIVRSIPFLILLIMIIPLTRIIVGKELRSDGYHRSSDSGSGTVHCQNGGIFSVGGRLRSN